MADGRDWVWKDVDGDAEDCEAMTKNEEVSVIAMEVKVGSCNAEKNFLKLV